MRPPVRSGKFINIKYLKTISLVWLSLAAAPAFPQTTRVLWDEWYTMTIGTRTRYGYYNDRAEDRGDKVFFKNDVWKKEEQFTNRETIGALAQNDPGLTSLFFNYHALYRLSETMIDGLIQNGNQLTVKIKRGQEELAPVKRGIPHQAILSTLFPIWLGKHLATMKEGQSLHFEAIQEDGVESGFGPVEGAARLEKSDDTARKLSARKLTVDYRGQRSVWWVDNRGAALRIESPEQKLTVQRVTKNQALHFLDGTAGDPPPGAESAPGATGRLRPVPGDSDE